MLITDLLMYCFSGVGYIVYYLTWISLTFTQKIFNTTSYNADNVCEIKKIIWRWKFFLIDITAPSDFIGIRQFVTGSEYVLKPTVSLYCISKNCAYFVECPTSVNVFDSTVNPFLYIGQFKNATKLITIPLSEFYKLADKVGDPKVKVCYMANTGRCGSTVLAQVLENVPGTLLLAEPDCFTNIGLLKSFEIIDQYKYEKLLIATMRLLCKPYNDVTRIYIKTRTCGTSHINAIHKHLPNTVILFGYRNNLKTVSSFLGLMTSETVQSMSMYLIDSETFSACVPWFRQRLFYYFCKMIECSPPKENAVDMNTVQQFAYAWANCMTVVMDFKKSGGKVLPILYEDMVKDKAKTITQVFEAMGIDKKFLEVALDAFGKDSQARSPLSKDNINNMKRRTVHEVDIIKCTQILAKYGLPELGQEFRFK